MNILAIGAHPDDLEYGCGGTLLKFAQKGHKINLLVMTSGNCGGKPVIREKEQGKSAKILKAKLYWGGFKDTQVPLNKKVINKIENVIKETKPDIIFVHYNNDTHQDHRHTAQATITATRYQKNVLFYEVPTTHDFSSANIFVDIGKMMAQKLELLKTHKSQVFTTRVAELSILESAESTAMFRGFKNRVKYAEGFVSLRLSLAIPDIK